MIPRPHISHPIALRDWFLARDVGVMPFAALEGHRRQQTAKPEELLVIALYRYRRALRDPVAKLRVTVRRMGTYTTMHIIAATPMRTVRAKTMAGVIRKAALQGWGPAPKYLQHLLDSGYTKRKEVRA